MVIRFLIWLSVLSLHISAAGVELRKGNIEIYDPDVRTVSLRDPENDMAIPVTDIDSPSGLILNFDIIGESHETLKARLSHRNYDWQPSSLLPQEWLDGINEFLIEDYAYSSGTYTHYVNYSFPIIPRELGISLGGNFFIEIFKEEEPEKTILAVPFSVSENLASVSASVSSSTDRGFNSTWQQLQIETELPHDLSRNPLADVIVTVSQNGVCSSERKLSSPQSLQGNKLSFSHIPELIFPAGNEYRRFETVRKDYPGMHVESVAFSDGIWTATLSPDSPRADSQYSFDSTQHGRFFIDEYDATDPDLGADYVMVEFRLLSPFMSSTGYYVDGEFSRHILSDSNKMHYDPEENAYILRLPLKQGSYNYRYIAHSQGKDPDAAPVEGNFYETSNEYLIKMFLRLPGSRGDRLISYKRIVFE